MSESRHRVQVGASTIEYSLTHKSRKTLAIQVHPDLRVTVIAPEESGLEAIAARVRKRAPWILKQQREFKRHLPHQPPRQYVSGETHRYLGRQHRLKVVVGDEQSVKLARGRLVVTTLDPANTERVRNLVQGWYRAQAGRVFHERLRAVLPRFEHIKLKEPTLTIRTMKSRWGSCSEVGTITLNLKLIQVPKPHIDYVIVHELCHLVEHNHGQRFYRLLDRILPDWRERRHKLNQHDFS